MGLRLRPGESYDSMGRLGTPGKPASPGTRIGPYWKRAAGASTYTHVTSFLA